MNKNLFQVISGLRHIGVGAKVTRNIYKFPETYWIVTRVMMAPDQQHGKVWGRLVWRGVRKDKDERICSALKKQWGLLSLPDYTEFEATPEQLTAIVQSQSLPRQDINK